MLNFSISLKRLCDLVALLVLILRTIVRTNKLIWIHIKNKLFFVLLNISLVEGVLIEIYKISILKDIYFSLTC